MYLTELIPFIKLSIDNLSESTDEEIVNFIRMSLFQLSTRLGIPIVVTGTNYLDYQITSPEVTDGLRTLIILQSKQIANGSSTVIKTKVGSIAVEYNADAWARDQAFLDRLLDEYASENNITLPGGMAIIGTTEYHFILNPNFAENLINSAVYGNLDLN